MAEVKFSNSVTATERGWVKGLVLTQHLADLVDDGEPAGYIEDSP